MFKCRMLRQDGVKCGKYPTKEILNPTLEAALTSSVYMIIRWVHAMVMNITLLGN
jgi:hypothetical protein